MLLMACMSVVLLSLSDTITNSLKFSKDVIQGSIQQKQFNIALSQLTTRAKFSICIAKKRKDPNFPAYIGSVPSEPGFTAAVIAVSKQQLSLSYYNNISPKAHSLGYLPWLESSLDAHTADAPDSVRFYLFAKRPSLNARNLSSECLGIIVLDSCIDNAVTYARVSLYSGNGIAASPDRCIASYKVPLKSGVPANYLIQHIRYWPRLKGYSLALPSFSDSFSALNTSQLNLQRFGIFSPNILFLP